jgi:hypothetical protein
MFDTNEVYKEKNNLTTEQPKNRQWGERIQIVIYYRVIRSPP